MKCECGDNIEPWYIRVYSKITYECKECGIQELDDREYYEDHYPNDIYRKSSGLHPEPRDWECPKHKDKHVNLLIENIRQEPRTDFNDTEPYIREDSVVIESIEKSEDMCECGHIYDNHFPSWGAEPLKCKFETCNCLRFKEGEGDPVISL
jgi:hypothetical protein